MRVSASRKAIFQHDLQQKSGILAVGLRLFESLGLDFPGGTFSALYADDLVMCCRSEADKPLTAMRSMMTKQKLTVNEMKTRVCKLPEEKFDFLGYTFGRCYSRKTSRTYFGTVPSKKQVQRICAAISHEPCGVRAWPFKSRRHLINLPPSLRETLGTGRRYFSGEGN
jgi:hypothetical protein